MFVWERERESNVGTWFEWRSNVPKCESAPISGGNVGSALFLKFDIENAI